MSCLGWALGGGLGRREEVEAEEEGEGEEEGGEEGERGGVGAEAEREEGVEEEEEEGERGRGGELGSEGGGWGGEEGVGDRGGEVGLLREDFLSNKRKGEEMGDERCGIRLLENGENKGKKKKYLIDFDSHQHLEQTKTISPPQLHDYENSAPIPPVLPLPLPLTAVIPILSPPNLLLQRQ